MNVSYYIRRSQVNKKGRTLLMLDITWRGYRLQCSSGVLIMPGNFTPAGKKLIATGEENSLSLNWQLGQLKLNLERDYIAASHKDGRQVEFSVEDMRKLVASLTGRELRKAASAKPQPVAGIIELHAKWQALYRQKYSESQLRKFVPVLPVLLRYCPSFTLALLEEQWVDRYVAWLLENTTLGNAMINIHLQFFRTMLKLERLPVDWLSLKLSENEVEVSLSYQEMLSVQQASYSTVSLRKAADAYVFLCQVGLRYGDYRTDFAVEELLDAPGVLAIRLRQQKTKGVVTVPLNELARQLWHKYGGNLPKYVPAAFNKLLKQVGVEAGLARTVEVQTVRGRQYSMQFHPLHELLTAHTARHTFASLLLEGSGNKEVAQHGLGHRTQSATGIYARPKTAQQAQDILKAWENLKQKN